MALRRGFAALTGAAREDVGEAEARDGLTHVLCLTLTKVADGLLDAKLVLAFLLTALGAPGAMVGALTPVREAGALLPQLALAPLVARSPLRKRIWAAGAVAQGCAALGIAAAALTLEGAAAGLAILGLLALLAIGRAASSLSFKDALARTVAKRRRGAVSGVAGSIGALVAFAIGAGFSIGAFEQAAAPLAGLAAAGGAAFLIGAALFLRLHEAPRAGEGRGQGRGEGLGGLLRPLRDAPQLRIFILARALLTVTALAPPFLVMLSAAGGEGSLSELGPLMMASTAAGVLASYVWGRLADRSSRRCMAAAGGLAALVYAGAGAAGLATGGLGGIAGAAAAVFAAQIAYAGVRAARKLHLTDMAGDAERARWTALSNSLIGVVLAAGAGFGALADMAGPAVVLLVFAPLSAVGALTALRLDEVQAEG